MAFPTLLAFLLSLLLSFSPTLSTNNEGNALHALRSRLSDHTNVLQSWDPTLVNPCTWFHITCDSNNHVIRLDLGNSNISGSLGPELGELKKLQYLELYNNQIRGKIPKELGNLKNLISMDLYGNRFEGKIPKSFAKLKSITFLRLNNNKLTGSIPRELTTLSNLKVFDVSNNDLCGTIPVNGPFGSFPMESNIINVETRRGKVLTIRVLNCDIATHIFDMNVSIGNANIGVKRSMYFCTLPL
ncbi:leucine-rich repeat (LRR) family protein [Actinidia rufa]|uniref:Leucine-rich repeat (LRR) family protein n=1 Tax=Actinidia rufa TaxID=165716 RepID=A0A7J0GNG9_9ERIC|nr:leucine-rich repeat (LRR) family protein [Actinidia rufa]